MVSSFQNSLKMAFLFIFMLAFTTENEEINLAHLEGYYTFYQNSIYEGPIKTYAAIMNNKTWKLYEENGIEKVEPIDLKNMKLMETNEKELIWKMDNQNLNLFKSIVRARQECTIWKKWPDAEDKKRRKKCEKQGCALFHIFSKMLKHETKQQRVVPSNDIMIADVLKISIKIGDKFLVQERFSMFHEKLWFEIGDLWEVQDLLPNESFIFKTIEESNLVSDVKELREIIGFKRLKKLSNNWTNDFMSDRYKIGTKLLEIESSSKRENNIFYVQAIDKDTSNMTKLSLVKYDILKENIFDNYHLVKQIVLNSKTMKNFYPLPFSCKSNLMQKLINYLPSMLQIHFMHYLNDDEFLLLNLLFGESIGLGILNYQNSIEYKALCMRHLQKTFTQIFILPYKCMILLKIETEKHYSLNLLNFPYRRFQLILQGDNIPNLHFGFEKIQILFTKWKIRNEKKEIFRHEHVCTRAEIAPGGILKFTLSRILWLNHHGKREGHLLFPENDGEFDMEIQPLLHSPELELVTFRLLPY